VRTLPRRPFWAHLAAVFGLFALGPIAGTLLATRLAPGSVLLDTVAPFAFGFVFFAGYLLWAGLGLAAAAIHFFRALGRRELPGNPGPGAQVVPGGYASFLVVGTIIGVGLGFVGMMMASVAAGAVFLSAGIGYGLLLRAAAHHGYLPFPEEA